MRALDWDKGGLGLLASEQDTVCSFLSFVLTLSRNCVFAWGAPAGFRLCAVLRHTPTACGAAVGSADLIASGGGDGYVRVWTCATRSARARTAPSATSLWINSVSFALDKDRLLSGTEDDRVPDRLTQERRRRRTWALC